MIVIIGIRMWLFGIRFKASQIIFIWIRFYIVKQSWFWWQPAMFSKEYMYFASKARVFPTMPRSWPDDSFYLAPLIDWSPCPINSLTSENSFYSSCIKLIKCEIDHTSMLINDHPENFKSCRPLSDVKSTLSVCHNLHFVCVPRIIGLIMVINSNYF